MEYQSLRRKATQTLVGLALLLAPASLHETDKDVLYQQRVSSSIPIIHPVGIITVNPSMTETGELTPQQKYLATYMTGL
jgi:hypothetical protein